MVNEPDPRVGIADFAEWVQWKSVGHVTRDDAGDLVFPPVRPVPAIYRFTIKDGPQVIAEYIGQAVNLVKRFRLYRTRGRKPALPLAKKTTSRNARKLLDALRAGRVVRVAIVDDRAITSDGQVILINLADKALRDELEKKLIESLRATGIEVLNR
jgi:hypothetical protein